MTTLVEHATPLTRWEASLSDEERASYILFTRDVDEAVKRARGHHGTYSYDIFEGGQRKNHPRDLRGAGHRISHIGIDTEQEGVRAMLSRFADHVSADRSRVVKVRVEFRSHCFRRNESIAVATLKIEVN